MQRLSPDNFGASDNIFAKLLQATWWTLVHKQKLEVYGKARREAARRRNSECSRPTAVTGQRRSHQCAAPPANHRSLYGCRPTAIAARGISAIAIHFALGIAAPGGLTSGFALPI